MKISLVLGDHAMRDIILRLKTLIKHLELIDDFFYEHENTYREFSDKISHLPHYENILDLVYIGKKGRQMMLADLLSYVVLSRGITWLGIKDRSECIRFLLYISNLVLAQEHLTQSMYLDLRRKFMEYLEETMIKEGLEELFFADDEVKRAYEETKRLNKDLIYKGSTRKHYYVLDSLMIKPVGLAVELITYAHLLRFCKGYVLPLGLHQRIFSKNDYVIPPNYLVILSDGRVFGVEVKQAAKAPEHIFQFMAKTGIPVLLASIPNEIPLRCLKCRKWILFCEKAINELASYDKPISYYRSRKWKISCIDCEYFKDGSCKYVIYYGKTSDVNENRHYHYHCVIGDTIVRESVGENPRKRLLMYIPHVNGLEELEE